MGTLTGVIIAAVVGAAVAVGVAFGTVSVIESRQVQVQPVDQQLTVYGGR
jgi:hypothetical protein